MFSKLRAFFANIFKRNRQNKEWRNRGSEHAANPSNPQPLDPGNDPWRT